MKTFRKYQFGSKGAATTKINALGTETNEQGDVVPTYPHAIVHLGNLVVTPAVYDEEGNEVTPPVMTSTYHIDVLWDGEPDASWSNQLVWCPPMGVHVFGSSSAIAEWVEKCKELHPEYFPKPDTTE